MLKRIVEAKKKFFRQFVPFENKPTYLYISSDLLEDFLSEFNTSLLIRNYENVGLNNILKSQVTTICGLEVVEIHEGKDILFVG